MSLENNKSVVRAYVDAFNRGDLEALRALFAPGALIYGVLGWGEIDKAMPIWRELVHSLKMNLVIDDMAAEGDTVAVRYTERGTFVAPFRGKEPTGKSYELIAMEWFKLENGKIARRWGARDAQFQSRQLGTT